MANAVSDVLPLTQTYLGNAKADDFNCKRLNGIATDSFTFRFTVPAVAAGQSITVADISTDGFKYIEQLDVCAAPTGTTGQLSVIGSIGVFLVTPSGGFTPGRVYCARAITGSNQASLLDTPITLTVSGNTGGFEGIEVSVTLSK